MEWGERTAQKLQPFQATSPAVGELLNICFSISWQHARRPACGFAHLIGPQGSGGPNSSAVSHVTPSNQSASGCGEGHGFALQSKKTQKPVPPVNPHSHLRISGAGKFVCHHELWHLRLRISMHGSSAAFCASILCHPRRAAKHLHKAGGRPWIPAE